MTKQKKTKRKKTKTSRKILGDWEQLISIQTFSSKSGHLFLFAHSTICDNDSPVMQNVFFTLSRLNRIHQNDNVK